MNILIIDAAGAATDWALRCKMAGHKVKWFICPLKTGERNPTGDGLITKVPSWKPHMEWADLIFLTDNIKEIEALEPYRKKGYPIFGPGVEATKLELDRQFGQDAFKKAGIQVMDGAEFKDYDSAIKHVLANPTKRFVSKPSGDADKALSYVSSDAADMIFMLERWKELGKNKAPFILQEFQPGIEMAVGGWFGKNGWSKWFCENFEHKKLMSGDSGPNTGEQGTVLRYVQESTLADLVLQPLTKYLKSINYVGYLDVAVIVDKEGNPWPLEFTCYDDQTEVLTLDGFKLFKDVKVGELVATMDPETRELQYQPVKDVIRKPYSGEMIHFGSESNGVDLCVTPDHSMWARRPTSKKYDFYRADQVEGKTYEIDRTVAVWKGEDRPTFILPAYVEQHWLGKHNKAHEIIHPALEMPMEVWLFFLGLFIAEGSLGKGVYQVNIAQKPHNMHKLQPFLDHFPMKMALSDNGVTINSIQLGSYIASLGLGGQADRFIPVEFKNLATKYLDALLNGLMAGDGSTHKRTGQRTYYTTSPRLASDVTEIILKQGNLARAYTSKVAGSLIQVGDGKIYARNHDILSVSERTQKKYSWTDRRSTKRVPYEGEVFCLNVPPHHLLYVRRNGNSAWSGNCRPGWPCFVIQCAMHLGDPAQWMLDLINGKDTLEVDEDVVTGVVMAIPDYPYGNKELKELQGFPVYCDDALWLRHVHPCELKLVEAPAMQDDKVVLKDMFGSAGNYLVVVTGIGGTVSASSKAAYKHIKKVKIPNSPMWRDDIGERMEKQLPELQENDIAMSWEY